MTEKVEEVPEHTMTVEDELKTEYTATPKNCLNLYYLHGNIAPLVGIQGR